jgi:arsenite methyltransferase
MKTIQVYDKPMCCSTGICGPEVDPVLTRFAADLEWLKAQGHRVARFNLAQEPMVFAENASVQRLLVTRGTPCLPVVLVDGEVVSTGAYPSRDDLSKWAGESPRPSFAVTGQSGPCCGESGCC